ncbi:MAG: mechanosensitive ion channel [Pseudomonadota bacterium]|nr:mechanosensitive ion channel [Pseudomonadota bacterium]
MPYELTIAEAGGPNGEAEGGTPQAEGAAAPAKAATPAAPTPPAPPAEASPANSSTHPASAVFHAPNATPSSPPSSAPSAAASSATTAGPGQAPVLSTSDASARLEHRLTTRAEDFYAELSSIHFYIELSLIALAIFIALALSRTFKTRIMRRLAASPPKHIDIEFITKPLLLLTPAVMLLLLWTVGAVVTGFKIGGAFTNGIAQLCYAYLLTSCVFMVVRQRAVAYFLSVVIIVHACLRAARVAWVVSGFLDSLAYDVGRYHLTALHVLHGFVIFVVVFWGAGLLSGTLESYLRRTTRLTLNTRHLVTKFFRIFIYIGAVIITLSAVGIDLTAFAIFGGALGVGVGLGLQKMTSNFVSGMTMLVERSIKIGDLIEVSGYTGWVRQLNIRYALLETSDGRDVLIPNEELISTRVVNWTLTSTMARIEIKVTINFESDVEKARELLLVAARQHPRCLEDPAPNCWLSEFTDHGPLFRLGFWISDVKEGRNGPQSDVMFEIIKTFKQNNIVLAHA